MRQSCVDPLNIGLQRRPSAKTLLLHIHFSSIIATKSTLGGPKLKICPEDPPSKWQVFLKRGGCGPKSAVFDSDPPPNGRFLKRGFCQKKQPKITPEMSPTLEKCLYFHDLAQNREPQSVVMLREPAGEMDRKIGFTDGQKVQQTLIFPSVFDLAVNARRFTAYTFACYCTSRVTTVHTKVAARTKMQKDKQQEKTTKQKC